MDDTEGERSPKVELGPRRKNFLEGEREVTGPTRRSVQGIPKFYEDTRRDSVTFVTFVANT